MTNRNSTLAGSFDLAYEVSDSPSMAIHLPQAGAQAARPFSCLDEPNKLEREAMRPIAIVLTIVFAASVARAEVGGESYLSPDKTKELRIARTSEAPDLTAKLLHSGKEIWSQKLSVSPGDKVNICWRPDSLATIIEHINEQQQCRLYIVEVGEHHVRISTVSPTELRGVSSVNLAKVAWEKDGTIALDVETKAGTARRRIVWSCHLVPIETK